MAVKQQESADEAGLPGSGEAGTQPDDLRPSTVAHAAVIVRGATRQLCHVRSLTPDGLRARIRGRATPGEMVAVELIAGQRIGGHVVWCHDGEAGIAFESSAVVENTRPGPGSAQAARLAVDRLAMIRSGADISFASTRDISGDGVRVMTERPLPKGAAITVTIEGFRPIEGVVRGERGGLCVISFNQIIPPADLKRWLAS